MFSISKKGLSGFDLKYLALVFMVLDHVHYFFGFTGKVPVFFSWIGRMAAPLFLFCFVEGFIHTHDRWRYFLRIYLLSVVMGAVRFGFYNVLSPAVRGDGFFPENAMLSSFAILFVVMEGIDLIRRRKFFTGLLAVILPLALPYLFSIFVFMPLVNSGNSIGLFAANLVTFTVLPLHASIADGGTVTVLQGMVLLIFSYCRDKRIRVYAWAVFTVLINAAGLVMMGMPLSGDVLFYNAYEWMEVFSAVFMLCYNGERGKGNGRMFYLFYPAHIYVLYGLSCVVYMVMG